jgi:hypothetical protein
MRMPNQKDVRDAKENWEDWQCVFEPKGHVRNNPLLQDKKRFNKFLREYSVRRTIRRDTGDDLRKRLTSASFNIDSLVRDRSGETLTKRAYELRKSFGTHDPPRAILSAMSKIAAFLAPHAFIAWDQYARKGLNIALGRPPSRKFPSYAAYLKEVNGLLSGEIGNRIKSACVGEYPSKEAKKDDRFHRRVLDIYLMRLGGRWKPRAQ